MPLPTDTQLSLLGCSHIGSAIQSKTKKAMVIRMSAETLDAIGAFSGQPQLDFVFGPNPAIWVGDQSFTMRPGPEKQNELYLRTPAASKKTAPLKFHATVVGKFTVERELDDDIHDKIRESTQDAVNQRANRQTILIDAPLDMPAKPKAKKKEEPSMFRKPLRPADKPKPAVPTPVASSSKNPSPSPSKESLALRRHLVHCLAAGDKTRDQLLASINSSTLPRPASHDLQDVLADIAEQTSLTKGDGDKSSKVYTLRLDAWKDVRPYDWSPLSDNERTIMARRARSSLKSLGIPETDPLWDYCRFRPSAPSAQNSTPESSQQSTRLAESKAVALMKETAKRTASSGSKDRKPSRPESSLSSRPREEQRTTSSRQDPGMRIKSESNPSGPPRHHSPQTSRSKPGDVSNDDRAIARAKKQKQSDPSSDSPALSMNRSSSASQNSKASHKLPPSGTGSDTERVRRKDPYAQQKSTPSHQHDRTVSTEISASLKRKLNPRDESDTDSVIASKKRRQESSDTNSRSVARQGGGSEHTSQRTTDPRRREPPPAAKPPTHLDRQETSPPPKKRKVRPADGALAARRSPVVHASNGQNGASKQRRQPIYTSSEDDDEDQDMEPRRPHTHSTNTPTTSLHSIQPPRPSTTDSSNHHSLRAQYDSSYRPYIDTFQKLVAQRTIIDKALKGLGSTTDSDIDSELLDPEDLTALAQSHQKLREELVGIRQVFQGPATA